MPSTRSAADHHEATRPAHADLITNGHAVLGIELGSTRIKGVLIGADHKVIAQGSFDWENQLVGGRWTYALETVWEGIEATVSDVFADAERQYGVRPNRLAGLGFSAMMHGYLAFDADGELLVPFRTWRNTDTDAASRELTTELNHPMPHRWSGTHLYQAALNDEEHVDQVAFLTTLGGYVHWRLTGQKVIGIGDASGMFPVSPETKDYDAERAASLNALLARHGHDLDILDLLPTPLTAGEDAGSLTDAGALLLDPTGQLAAGVPLCPPEGDAGTGMVATGAIRPRTGNVSAGTSIFAMVVLEQELSAVHPELDIVSTPSGDLVAMVHCNNGASELGAWAGVFGDFADRLGAAASSDSVFGTLLSAALEGEADADGVYTYNFLSGEPIAQVTDGRPLIIRTPSSNLTLANLMRAQVYGIFATLSLGMRILESENVALDTMYAHGGIFRTAGVAQRLLAAALGVPVAVPETAAEGGAWGIAVLAAFRARGAGATLDDYLQTQVLAGSADASIAPDPADVDGYRRYLTGYETGLPAARAAASVVEP